ncbi:MAG: hypothetical protein JWN18_211 [Parcubacteria group bacterium]|nr:hypothetical protein [Parcubacteria group bacterium]
MAGDDYAKQIARWVALGALFLLPLTPFIVANSFFFPFITGKAFYSRILIEIAFAGWVALVFLDKEYRPRLSWIGIAALAFVGWMFVADLFAVNVQKAFWSNFERMEGWVMLAHLLGLFFAASNILRVEKKWRAWFLTTLGVSVLISGYALLQLAGSAAIHQGSTRIDASLGNSAYLAIYLLFNVFVALWLALTEKYTWLKWSLIALAVVEAILIFFTETRGTVLGLIAALGLSALLIAFTAGKQSRQWASAGLVVLVLLVGSFYAARNSTFIQSNHTLQRVASISLNDGQTRFTLWHMAFEGALERPIVGWGQEGFNFVFNKYFDPKLYGQESWFDRAHNAFIDWLIAGGFPAFLLYLSLFGTALVLLWRSSELSRAERIALTAALVGYAVHNLFVFDNLYSYIYFFALLALIDSQLGRPIKQIEEAPIVSATDGITYVLPVVAVVAFAVVWVVNVPGMGVATKLITALSPSQAGIASNIALFQDLSAHPAFAAQEVREQLVSFASSVVQSSEVADTDKQQVITLAVTEMMKQVTAYPTDAREHLELSFVYRSAGDAANALKEVLAAAALSPKKQEMWIQAGAAEWDAGNLAAAQKDFHTAYELAPQFTDLAAYAAAGDIAVGDIASADKTLLAAYGTTTIDNNILAIAYYRSKNWKRLVGIWQLRASAPEATIETLFSLAAAYYAAGDPANAIRAINDTVKRYPDAAASGAAAIKQIQSGVPIQ